MKTNAEILRQFKKHKKSVGALSKQYQNTRMCHEFVAGDFMSYRDRVATADGKGAMVQFNKVKPYVDSVAGFMAQMRRKPAYLARVPSETPRRLYSDYATALSDWAREECNADQVETAQDREMLIAGYAATDKTLSWDGGRATTTPHGELMYGGIDGESVFWDHTARAPNVMDRKYCGYKKEFDLDEAMALMDAPDEAFEDGDDDDEGNGFVYNPRGGSYKEIRELQIDPEKDDSLDWSSREGRSVYLWFYQWYEIETFYRADNPLIGMDPATAMKAKMVIDALVPAGDPDDEFGFSSDEEIWVCDAETKDKLEQFFGDQVQFYSAKRKCFYGAIISGKTVFRAAKLQSQAGFGIQFKTATFDKKNKIWVGMVNSMKDPVLYFNKGLTELMYIIATNSKGGVMYEENTIEKINEFEANYAKTNGMVKVRKGALMENRIKPKREPFQPSGYENIIQIADTALTDVVGIDKTFWGFQQNDESGVLFRRRVKQAMTVLALYFDAITLYQKEDARMSLDLLRELVENSPGRMFEMVTGAGKIEFLTMASDKMAAEYSITIQEAPESIEDKQEKGQVLFALGDKLQATGDPAAKQIYAIGVKQLRLDGEDAQKIIEALVPDQSKPDPAYVKKLEQTVQQLMDANQAATLELTRSATELNKAKRDQTMADTHQKAAQTIKTLGEAEQTELETSIAKRSATQEVHVTI